MKLIFISEDNELESVKRVSLLDDQELIEVFISNAIIGKNQSLAEVANNITKKLTSDNKCIIFIPLFLRFSDEGFHWLQNQGGIALIKFLRLMKVNNHIVLISPYNLHQLILQKTGNLIVASPGITISDSYEIYQKMTLEDLQKKASEIQNNDLRDYFLADFRFPEDERHNWANWWGIVRLFDVHRSIFPEQITNPAQRYPSNLEHILKKLRNLQALYLYHPEMDYGTVLSEVAKSQLKQAFSRLEREIQDLRIKTTVFGKKNPKSDHWADFILDRTKLLKLYQYDRDWIQNTKKKVETQRNTAIAALAEGKARLSAKQKELLILSRNLNNPTSNIDNGPAIANLKKSQKNRKSNKPKILYIDDQAMDGWSEIFQMMIYGEIQKGLFCTYDDCYPEMKEIYLRVSDIIKTFDPNIVLLDLRLKREQGIKIDVAHLSGAQILESLRRDYPGLPVMIITASNKSWSLSELLKLGCDAYWTKEGLDSKTSNQDSVQNYLAFINYIDALTGKHYQSLKSFSKEITKITDTENIWWKEYSWPNQEDPYQRSFHPDSDIVYKILKDSLLIMRDYLANDIMKNEKKSINDWLYPSLIIQNLSKIVEHIHGVTRNHQPSTKHIAEVRCDKEARELLLTRGFASHFITAQKITIEEAEKFMEKILKYIFIQPVF